MITRQHHRGGEHRGHSRSRCLRNLCLPGQQPDRQDRRQLRLGRLRPDRHDAAAARRPAGPAGQLRRPDPDDGPAPGSPAIDAGNNALIPAGITTDQRGDSRGSQRHRRHRRLREPLPAIVASVSSSVNPSAYGQSVTFTATISDTSGLVPAGSVEFYDGPTDMVLARFSAAADRPRHRCSPFRRSERAVIRSRPSLPGLGFLKTARRPQSNCEPVQYDHHRRQHLDRFRHCRADRCPGRWSPAQRDKSTRGPNLHRTQWRQSDRLGRQRHCFERIRHCQLYAARWYGSRHLHDQGRLQWDRRLRHFHRHEPFVDDHRPSHDHVEHHNSPHRRRLGHTR